MIGPPALSIGICGLPYEAAAWVFDNGFGAVEPELQLHFVKHVINDQWPATVVGVPSLVVERLELLLAGGLDWADEEAGRALPRRRGRYHPAAQPHPKRAQPGEASAPGRHRGGGGGHALVAAPES